MTARDERVKGAKVEVVCKWVQVKQNLLQEINENCEGRYCWLQNETYFDVIAFIKKTVSVMRLGWCDVRHVRKDSAHTDVQ